MRDAGPAEPFSAADSMAGLRTVPMWFPSPLPECFLWSAVIGQMVSNACIRISEKSTSDRRTERDEARCWLLTDNPNLQMVCDYAGIDAGYVRRAARKLERRGWCLDEAKRGAQDAERKRREWNLLAETLEAAQRERKEQNEWVETLETLTGWRR
jgi:hypothetical protein